MIGGLLIDTGFFFALHTANDNHHATARTKEKLLDDANIILPWPVLYETLNTSFVKNWESIDWLDRWIKSPNTVLIDDSKYRSDCYNNVLATSKRNRPISLVDVVLRAVIEDENVRVSAILTFNPKDFVDVCRKHRVEML